MNFVYKNFKRLTRGAIDANIYNLIKEMMNMPEIEIKKDESFESALRRFKRKIEQEGILRELRDRKHYEKPSERKRKKARMRK